MQNENLQITDYVSRERERRKLVLIHTFSPKRFCLKQKLQHYCAS